MSSCIYIFDDRSFNTQKELEDYIKETYLKDLPKVLKDEDYVKTRDSVLYPNVDPNSIETAEALHKNTFSGDRLTGIGANTFKELAYNILGSVVTHVVNHNEYMAYKNGETKTPPKVIQIDYATYDDYVKDISENNTDV